MLRVSACIALALTLLAPRIAHAQLNASHDGGVAADAAAAPIVTQPAATAQTTPQPAATTTAASATAPLAPVPITPAPSRPAPIPAEYSILGANLLAVQGNERRVILLDGCAGRMLFR